MLAMQGGPLIGPSMDSSWSGWNTSTTHDKLRRLMDLPASIELEMSRHDRWTALMEACNFGHRNVVEALLSVPSIDLEALNIRGQRAEDVASSRGHDHIAKMVETQRLSREQPEEMSQIRQLEEQVETLKAETRHRLLQNIDKKYAELSNLRSLHEREIETLTRQIDSLQEQLDQAMKSRLSMITRQVRIVKNAEEEIRQLKRKLDNFDRYASANNVSYSTVAISPMTLTPAGGPPTTASLTSSLTNISRGPGQQGTLFDKDFECSVCLDDMKPPVKIFQCKNGHVMCESCKNHPEVLTCPTCRIPLTGAGSSHALMRNIPMEKLARSYFEQIDNVLLLQSASISRSSRSANRSRRGSCDQLLAATAAINSANSRASSQPRSLASNDLLL